MRGLRSAAIIMLSVFVADVSLACGTPAQARQLWGDLSRRLICESKNAPGWDEWHVYFNDGG